MTKGSANPFAANVPSAWTVTTAPTLALAGTVICDSTIFVVILFYGNVKVPGEVNFILVKSGAADGAVVTIALGGAPLESIYLTVGMANTTTPPPPLPLV
jgi:hypothetical protein